MAGMPYGLQAMLKDGYKHMSGLSEAVLKNLEACQELSKITRTSLGPNGAQLPRGTATRPKALPISLLDAWWLSQA